MTAPDLNAEEDTLLRENSQFSKLENLLQEKQSSEPTALITMQYTPDPDSLASALGLQWLLEVRFGMAADIIAKGEVSHPQNQTMKNVLDIRLSDKGRRPYEDYDVVFVVDTVPQNTGFQEEIPEFHVILDHHHFELDFPIADIRQCGACSSIVWEYLTHYGVDWATERGVQVATALLFGIRNDTAGLLSENTAMLDIKAQGDLISKVDRKRLQEIIQYSFPSYLYDLRCTAVENKVVKDSMLISSLGILTRKKRDALPIIADEFMRMEGVETVVVHAVVGDYLEASVRSKNSSISVHDFCQKIFGSEYAGGKTGAGGAKRPLGFLFDVNDTESLKAEVCDIAGRLLTDRILAYLSGG
jgi:nanoRNase/pAp phosphatase (c-di-AMP/oligoRNAs hydrolase)